MVPFVGNGLNFISITDKQNVAPTHKNTQQQMSASLNQKQMPNMSQTVAAQSQKQPSSIQQTQLLSRASQNNQKFVANFGRRAMVPL